MPSCLQSKGFHIFVDPLSPARDPIFSDSRHWPPTTAYKINLLTEFEQEDAAPSLSIDNTIPVLLEQLGTEKGLSVGVGDEERNGNYGVIIHTNTHGKSALLWQTSKATIRVFLSLCIVHWRYEVIKW
jgi:hypothetical protein